MMLINILKIANYSIMSTYLPSLSKIFTEDGFPNFTASTEEDTKDIPKDSVGSNRLSSVISISTHFSVSPGSNVISIVFAPKSSSPAVPAFVVKLKKKIA
jgi:hypothetical protein